MLTVLRFFLLVLVYWGTGKLGLAVPYMESKITLFWLPPGVAVAALLRYGWSCVPAITLGAYLTNVSVNLSPALAASISVGNTLAPVVCAYLLTRWKFRLTFERRRDSLFFCGSAALGAIFSSVPGVLSMYWHGILPSTDLVSSVQIWWLGDTLGILFAASFLMSLSASNLRRVRTQSYEFIAWLLLSVAIGTGVFFLNPLNEGAYSLPLAFLPLPLIVWAALRFGLFGASLSVLWFAALAVTSAHLGLGPFSMHTEVVVQLLIAAYFVTLAALALIITSVHGSLSQASVALQDSAARYRQMFDANPHPMWVYDLSTLGFLAVNEAAISHYGYSRDEFLEMTVKEIRVPEEVPVLMGMLSDLRLGGNSSSIWRHCLKSGQIILVEISSHAMIFNDRRARVVMITDITDRMHSESRLRHSEMLLNEAQHVAQIGCWEIMLPDNTVMLSDEVYHPMSET